MQTATSETEIKSHSLSICVHHYTLRAPCPKGQGKTVYKRIWVASLSFQSAQATVLILS